MRSYHPVRILVLPLLLVLAAHCINAGVSSLVVKSPFLPPEFSPPGEAGLDASIPASNSRFEFRGVYQLNGQFYFNVFDNGSRRANWVSRNSAQPGSPRIVEFRKNHDLLVIEMNGKQFELELINGATALPEHLNVVEDQQAQATSSPISPTSQHTAIRRPVIRSTRFDSTDEVSRRVLFRKSTTSN